MNTFFFFTLYWKIILELQHPWDNTPDNTLFNSILNFWVKGSLRNCLTINLKGSVTALLDSRPGPGIIRLVILHCLNFRFRANLSDMARKSKLLENCKKPLKLNCKYSLESEIKYKIRGNTDNKFSSRKNFKYMSTTNRPSSITVPDCNWRRFNYSIEGDSITVEYVRNQYSK